MPKITNILIVEDNDLVADLYQRLLNRVGYEVLLAPDTRTALQVLSGIEVDLIILDYELPDVKGVDWLMQLRSHPRYQQTPVILVSAIQRNDDLRWDRYVWFMEKPKHPQHIVTAVQHTIDQFINH